MRCKNGTINVIVAFKMNRSVFDVEKLMAVVDNVGCDKDCLNDSSYTTFYWKINLKNDEKYILKRNIQSKLKIRKNNKRVC